MKYETLHGFHIPKIGFGTWCIGGERSADPSLDEKSLLAMHSALELGYTNFDTAEFYAQGHAEELLATAVLNSKIPRENLSLPPRFDRIISDMKVCSKPAKAACAV